MKIPDRHRLHLSLAPAVSRRLERLLAETEAESVSEVIRRALAIYADLVAHQKAGGKVILRSKKGEDETLRIAPVGTS